MSLHPVERRARIGAASRERWKDPAFRARMDAIKRRKRKVRPPAVRFAAFVMRGHPDACWAWKGGGAKFWADGRYWKPREYAYFMAFGAFDGVVHVGEACKAKCCNPGHLVCYRAGKSSPKQMAEAFRLTRVKGWRERTADSVLWPKMDRVGDCWLWRPGSLLITYRGEKYTPRRLAYLLTYKAIPEGEVVRLTCGHVNCCNPAHMYLASPAADRRARPLDNAQIDELRRLYATGEFTQTTLAIEFGINQHMVSKLVNSTGYPDGLTDDQVRAIRVDPRAYKLIGSDYGISAMSVYRIRAGMTYASVGDE